jgi:hypothetical protein
MEDITPTDVLIYLRKRFYQHESARTERVKEAFESKLLSGWVRKVHAEVKGDHIPVKEFDKMCHNFLDNFK